MSGATIVAFVFLLIAYSSKGRGGSRCKQEEVWRDSDIDVIAKIESIDSLKNLEEIIQASDGAMVARGDVGAQIPL